MPDSYRSDLFARYADHSARLDVDPSLKVRWFRGYVRRNYLPAIQAVDRSTARFLELGCSTGYLLHTMRGAGFVNLHGVDLSPRDVEAARGLVPGAEIACADALDYLATRVEMFDVILAKALLEHIPKSEVIPLVGAVANALRPGGVAIIDVPNMDWLFAGHERYMDFTHEVGFTAESLRQVMDGRFTRIDIRPVDLTVPYHSLNARSRRARVRYRLQRLRVDGARVVLGTLLRWAAPDGGTGPIWCRSLVAVGRK